MLHNVTILRISCFFSFQK